ncbi:MAG: cysteine hydrolase [Thermoprotei archaeon]|nr:MAG: cysteine hydrolase [Thermoprotei archaeon]
MATVKIPEYKISEEKVILDSKTTALIIVDMQNDFAHPEGRLFVPEARKTIPAIKKLLEKARKAGVLVIYTQDWHRKEDIEFDIWGEHAVGGTWGAEVIEELKPVENEITIHKLRYDAFFGTPLDHLLRIYKINTLVITGTVANICVLHTAGTAALLGYKIVVPIDCISALTDFDKYTTYRQVYFLYKGILTKSENIEFR